MKRLIAVCGSRASGKTLVAQALVNFFKKQESNTGAWKPVDLGLLEYNASDLMTDGEILCQAAEMQEHISHLNPYLFNQILPPVLAARQDGVSIDAKKLNLMCLALQKKYPLLILESLPGLHSPFCQEKSWMDQLKEWNAEIVWVSGIGNQELETTLGQVKHFQIQGFPVQIVLNNSQNNKNSELLHYQWLTIEEQLEQRVLGLLPFLPPEKHEPNLLLEWLEKNIERTELLEKKA